MADLSVFTAKALPYLIDNAPTLWKAANDLVRSARKARDEIPVEARPAEGGAAMEAAVRDLEASLLTLNGQMEQTAGIVAELVQANAVLAERVRTSMVVSGASLLVALAAAALALWR